MFSSAQLPLDELQPALEMSEGLVGNLHVLGHVVHSRSVGHPTFEVSEKTFTIFDGRIHFLEQLGELPYNLRVDVKLP